MNKQKRSAEVFSSAYELKMQNKGEMYYEKSYFTPC